MRCSVVWNRPALHGRWAEDRSLPVQARACRHWVGDQQSEWSRKLSLEATSRCCRPGRAWFLRGRLGQSWEPHDKDHIGLTLRRSIGGRNVQQRGIRPENVGQSNFRRVQQDPVPRLSLPHARDCASHFLKRSLDNWYLHRVGFWLWCHYFHHLTVTVTPAFCLTFMVSFHAIQSARQLWHILPISTVQKNQYFSGHRGHRRSPLLLSFS